MGTVVLLYPTVDDVFKHYYHLAYHRLSSVEKASVDWVNFDEILNGMFKDVFEHYLDKGDIRMPEGTTEEEQEILLNALCYEDTVFRYVMPFLDTHSQVRGDGCVV